MIRRAWPVSAVIAAGTVASTAYAEAPRTTRAAVEVDRDDAPGGRASLGFDGGEPVDVWGASLATSWLERPISLTAGALGPGAPATQPVARRESLALGGAVAIGDVAVLDAVLRASHQIGDRLRAAGDPAPLARAAPGDLRLGGRIRLAGDRDRAALLRAELTLPTGDDHAFAGDARWSAAWSLIGRTQLPGGATAAATAGIRLRGAEVQIGDRLVGDELFGALGATLPLSALGLGEQGGPGLTAAVLGALGDRVGASPSPSPVEGRIGLTGGIGAIGPALRISAQVGFGVGDQIGAPRLRAVLALAWTPIAPPSAPATKLPPPDDDEPDEP